MGPGIASEQIDAAIAELIRLAIEFNLQESCTQTEAARIRLALQHPSEQMKQQLAEAIELIVDAMADGIPAVLNTVLFPED